jgi:hypothetical protein
MRCPLPCRAGVPGAAIVDLDPALAPRDVESALVSVSVVFAMPPVDGARMRDRCGGRR